MRIPQGEHADGLRAIGRLLDAELAQNIVLETDGEFLTLSWSRKGLGTERRHYQEADFERLRHVANQSRGTYRPDPRASYEESLRTLGQDLDREGGVLTRLVQERDVLIMNATVQGERVDRRLIISDLIDNSRKRRQQRSAPATPSGADAARGGAPNQPREIRPSLEAWGTGDGGGPLSRRLSK